MVALLTPLPLESCSRLCPVGWPPSASYPSGTWVTSSSPNAATMGQTDRSVAHPRHSHGLGEEGVKAGLRLPTVMPRFFLGKQRVVSGNVHCSTKFPIQWRMQVHLKYEILSQFDLTIEYFLGKDTIVADAISRFAYHATSAKQDISL